MRMLNSLARFMRLSRTWMGHADIRSMQQCEEAGRSAERAPFKIAEKFAVTSASLAQCSTALTLVNAVHETMHTMIVVACATSNWKPHFQKRTGCFFTAKVHALVLISLQSHEQSKSRCRVAGLDEEWP